MKGLKDIMPRRNDPRHGLTLVEVFVVIVLVGFLLSFAVAALVQGREAARRMHCLNNLTQIALAANNYHFSNNCFPYNYGNTASLTTAGTATCRSWLLAIVPYVEQTRLYDVFCHDQGKNSTLVTAATVPGFLTDNGGGKTPYDRAVGIVAPLFLCPAESSKIATAAADYDFPKGGPAITNYKGCSGANWGTNNYPSGVAYGPIKPFWNPTPSNGCDSGAHGFTTSTESGRNKGSTDGFEHGTGVICRNWTNLDSNVVGIADVRDGTANTFLAGETVASWNLWNWWYWPNCSTATCAIDLNWPKKRPDAATVPPAGPVAPGDQYQTGGFHSLHPGGANFAYCDGSVTFLNDAIDQAAYRALATIAEPRLDESPSKGPDRKEPAGEK